MMLIFAGNYAQAQNYVKEYGLNQSQYRIVTAREHIMGIDNFTFVRVGTWYSRSDGHEIMDIVRSRRGVKIVDG